MAQHWVAVKLSHVCRRRFSHATHDCVAPYVDIILHRGRFWAKSAASGSVRWCCFRSCWMVLSQGSHPLPNPPLPFLTHPLPKRRNVLREIFSGNLWRKLDMPVLIDGLLSIWWHLSLTRTQGTVAEDTVMVRWTVNARMTQGRTVYECTLRTCILSVFPKNKAKYFLA